MKASIKQTAPIRAPDYLPEGYKRYPNPGLVYTITAFVSLGSFLFGWNQGVLVMIIADDRWLDLMQPSNDCRAPIAPPIPLSLTLTLLPWWPF